MATKEMRPITAYGGAKEGQGAPVIHFPVAAAQTGTYGSVVTISSGQVSFQAGGDAAMLGILEQYIPTALTENALVPIRLALMGPLFEGSFNGATTQADLGDEFPLITSGTTPAFATLNPATASPGVKSIAFIGEQIGVFEEGGFRDKVGTQSSNNTNKPYLAEAGAFTDTNARVIFVFPSNYTFWGD